MPFITIKSTKIHYTKKGRGQPLIFLHGTYVDSYAYGELINIMAKKYLVYALDLPMHGKSSTPTRYLSMHDIIDMLQIFAKELRITNPTIAAHSAGAVAAIMYAKKNKVKELILMDPAGLKYFKNMFELIFNILFIKPIVAFYWSPKNSFKLYYSGALNFMRNLFNKNFWKLLRENVTEEYSKDMKKLTCPVKILWAKHDELLSFKYSDQFKNNVKNSVLIPVNSCHDWPVLNPKKIMPYLEK